MVPNDVELNNVGGVVDIGTKRYNVGGVILVPNDIMIGWS